LESVARALALSAVSAFVELGECLDHRGAQPAPLHRCSPLLARDLPVSVEDKVE